MQAPATLFTQQQPLSSNPASPAGGNVVSTFSGVTSAAGYTIVVSYNGNVVFTIIT